MVHKRGSINICWMNEQINERMNKEQTEGEKKDGEKAGYRNDYKKEVKVFFFNIQGKVNTMKCRLHSEQRASQPPFLLTAAQTL